MHVCRLKTLQLRRRNHLQLILMDQQLNRLPAGTSNMHPASIKRNNPLCRESFMPRRPEPVAFISNHTLRPIVSRTLPELVAISVYFSMLRHAILQLPHGLYDPRYVSKSSVTPVT
jgi:hypothetical protein